MRIMHKIYSIPAQKAWNVVMNFSRKCFCFFFLTTYVVPKVSRQRHHSWQNEMVLFSTVADGKKSNLSNWSFTIFFRFDFCLPEWALWNRHFYCIEMLQEGKLSMILLTRQWCLMLNPFRKYDIKCGEESNQEKRF